MHMHYLTPQGLAQLQQELEELKLVKRPQTIKRIEEAKAMGDLSENAEYDDAKEAQAMVEARIYEIDEILKSYQLIDDAAGAKKVRVGSTVHLDVQGMERTYTIVGSNEADPLAGKISNESPIGRALLGVAPGESVKVQTPGGETVYKIVSIS